MNDDQGERRHLRANTTRRRARSEDKDDHHHHNFPSHATSHTESRRPTAPAATSSTSAAVVRQTTTTTSASPSTADHLAGPPPASWPCRWDGHTLPYIPAPIPSHILKRWRHADKSRRRQSDHSNVAPATSLCDSVMVYWRQPRSGALRVCVPDARGRFTQLVPGVPYFEAPWHVLPVESLPRPPLQRDQGTQVAWEDLPVPPEAHARLFDEPQQLKSK